MKATVFVDVLSHWCLAAMPAVEALTELGVDCKIAYAVLNNGEPVGFTSEMEHWFYQRGTRAYGMTLDPAWCEGPHVATYAANAASFLAGEIIGSQRRAAEAMMSAAMRRGALLGRPDEAARAAAEIAGVSPAEISAHLHDDRVREALLDANRRLAALGADERPTFHLQNASGDYALLKGIWQKDAIEAVAHALRSDEQAYAAAGPAPF